MTVESFVSTYLPGIWILLGILLIHTVLATIVHIKKKDFNFGEWPKYMTNFIFYVIFIGLVNAILDLASNQIQNSIMQTIFIGIQAFVYVQCIGYYLNNIVKHLNELGVPIDPDLKDALGALGKQVRNLIGGDY